MKQLDRLIANLVVIACIPVVLALIGGLLAFDWIIGEVEA